MVAGIGRVKASVRHDCQSNCDWDVESGKGSDTVCFLGTQSDSRGRLTAGSSECNSGRRLFREHGGEGELSTGVEVGEGEQGVLDVRSRDSLLSNIMSVTRRS